MKPFELIYKMGFNQGPDQVNIHHRDGAALTSEEKKLLTDYLYHYMKNCKEKPGMVDVYISGFLAGVGYVGTHLREGPNV